MVMVVLTRLRRARTGQALVELALVLPILALVVLGTSDMARLFYFSVAVTNAAREGARHGAYYDPTTNGNAFETQGKIFAAVNSEPNYISLSQYGPPITPQPCPAGPPFASSLYPTAANTGNVIICFNGQWSSTAATPGQYVTVIVLYNYQPITPLLGSFTGSSTIHIEGTANVAVQGLT